MAPRTRPAAVAGTFYPRDKAELAALVRRLVDEIAVPDGEPLAPAYVVPHAGYRFSGPIAAQVYARLREHAGDIRRVVMLGPAHRVPLRGAAVSTMDHWVTPLGEIPLDTAGAATLSDSGYAAADDAPHAPEHSLEVQLPFLQEVVGDGVAVLPIAIGLSELDDVAPLLVAAGAGTAGTVVLCSTDLSHYLDKAAAEERDGRTAQAVLDLAPERVNRGDACGLFALRGTVEWARLHGLRPELLDLRNSGDTHGSADRVVGYPAFAFHD